MNKDIFKLPNLLTLFRIAMSAVLYLLYVQHFQRQPLLLFIMYIIIALTDLVDGIIARKFNMVTELGKELGSHGGQSLGFFDAICFLENLTSAFVGDLADLSARYICKLSPKKIQGP